MDDGGLSRWCKPRRRSLWDARVPLADQQAFAVMRRHFGHETQHTPSRRHPMKTTVGLTVVVVLLVTGCSTTQRVAVKEEPAICTFLGEVCHELQPGARGEAGLRWVNPKSDPTQYTKVLLVALR
jgi:hypothetical protein